MPGGGYDPDTHTVFAQAAMAAIAAESVAPPPPGCSDLDYQAGVVGQPYAYRFAASGSPEPTVAQSAGTLPIGLTLAADGTLSGTPTTARTFTFSVRAENGFFERFEAVRPTWTLSG